MTISARIVADSISPAGNRLTTFELECPRFIHAEFMTHRLFSRNAASSRAIPVDKAIKLIQENTAMPIHWGKNQPGMSAKEECNERYIVKDDQGETLIDWGRELIWERARDAAINFANAFNEAGYHKQIVNRLLEPFSHIKVVCTATEYDNFFWLRRHPDAQPEIQELAEQMWLARERQAPVLLQAGEWHVPYFKDGYWRPFMKASNVDDPQEGVGYTVRDAIMISASQCAQVSYRKSDDSLEKAAAIYERLVGSKPVHASPFEHQGTPISQSPEDWFSVGEWETGVTHCDREGNLWSGNFKGWIQNRQLIDGNYCSVYTP